MSAGSHSSRRTGCYQPCQQAGLDLSSEQENSMAKKKFIPPDGENRIRRRFHQLLHQKPKVYPDKPRSNKNGLLKPIRRS